MPRCVIFYRLPQGLLVGRWLELEVWTDNYISNSSICRLEFISNSK